MTPAEFEARLHALLDARNDPLADPACVAFLADHPERLEAFAHWQERCAALPIVAPRCDVVRRWRRPLPWVLIAAACVATLLLLRPATPAAAASHAAGRVIAASLQPIRPTLQATATLRARTVLLAEPTARLEVFQQWSTP